MKNTKWTVTKNKLVKSYEDSTNLFKILLLFALSCENDANTIWINC